MEDADRALRELAESLCSAAGAARVVDVEPPAFASSNQNAIVVDAAGDRFVLRVYGEKPEPHTAQARARRERWVLEMLADARAPVPRPLAAADGALLLPFVDGEALGTLAARRPPAEVAGAWEAAGEALAHVHAVDNERAAAAGCAKVGIRAPDASRGLFHYEEALTHLDAIGAKPLIELVEAARPLYEQAPLVLCQYDAHLWQFRLIRRGGRWECTAILDWEHADLDDPDWDLAQLDVFRFEPVGPVPPAFFRGYGRSPTSPLYTLYRIERAAWVLAAHARGAAWLDGSVPLAERVLVDALTADRRR